jgi:hypothetical protein
MTHGGPVDSLVEQAFRGSGSEGLMSLQRLAGATALCGTAALAGWLALARFDADLSHAAAAPLDGVPASATAAAADAAKSEDAVARDETAIEPALPVSLPSPETAAPPAAFVPPPDATPSHAREPASWAEAYDEWVLSDSSVDRYLWSLYERTPKHDTNKVSTRVKVTRKIRGKTRTITKRSVKIVDEDFTWKDAKAAEQAGMPLMQYVIGGMDPSFKLRLYRALRAMDDAGLEPGITSAFRDDYRQSLVSGKKAAVGSSYHGGSRRGGYGHGLAADLVSVKGETRVQRMMSSQILWQWIDAHGPEFGIGRPYLNRDPPHVGPIDGQEYAEKRGRARAKAAGWGTQKPPGSAENKNPSKAKDPTTASR